VISAVAFGRAARVMTAVLWIAGGEAPQSICRKKMLAHFLDHSLCAFAREHIVVQTHGENLIRSNGRVRRTTIHLVKQAADAFIPEQTIERPARDGSHLAIAVSSGIIAETLCEVFHDSQRVIPERLNLDRLAVSWRDYLVADLCIHPRELNARFAGGEQPARIDLDPVTCAAHVPRNNVGEYGTDIKVQQELLRHSTVQSTMNVYTQAVSEQKRAANSAVVDLLFGRTTFRLANGNQQAPTAALLAFIESLSSDCYCGA